MLLLISCGIIGIILNFSNISNPKEESENIESQQIVFWNISLDNWGTFLTILGLVGTAMWSMYQYTKSKNLNQQEKAAEIAKLFSDELLDKCEIIGNVIKYSELGNLLKLKQTDMTNLKRFDKEEISELYENEPYFWDKYETCIKNSDLQLTYLHLLDYRISTKSFIEISAKDQSDINTLMKKIMSEKYTDTELNNLESKNMLTSEFDKFFISNHSTSDLGKIYIRNYTDDEARKLFVLDNQNLPFKFAKLVSDVLNELEYICMYISSQSAGTYYIYQSLHQIFLKTIKNLAVTISYNNKNYTDKYYTNIIHVYKEWQIIRKQNSEKEKQRKAKAFKYLEPKIRRV